MPGAGPGPADADGGRKVAVVVAAVAGLAVVAVVLVVLALRSALPVDLGSANTGSEQRLAELRQGCEDGDMADCDALFWEADFGTTDEAFGDSCGGRLETTDGRWCVDVFDGG